MSSFSRRSFYNKNSLNKIQINVFFFNIKFYNALTKTFLKKHRINFNLAALNKTKPKRWPNPK